MSDVLDAVFFGYSVGEIEYKKAGKYIEPVDVIGKPQEWFIFSKSNELRLRKFSNGIFENNTYKMWYTGNNSFTWRIGFAATDSSGLVDVNDEETFPIEFNLSQRQSPVSSHQTLKVYDLLGREVVTLVDEFKPSGSYEVEFDASHLSSGMYIYKLAAGGFTSTKKLLLLK